MSSTLVHTTETFLGSATAEGDLSLPVVARTREGDLSPMRTGRKSDLFSRTGDGRSHEVQLKRAPMCPAGHPVTSKAHKEACR